MAAILLAVALVVTTTDDGRTIAARPAPPVVKPGPSIPGTLVFEAALAGDGAGFGERNFIGDAQASGIRFSRGAVEYSVVAPGGNTGNGIDIAPLKRYYTDLTLQVSPGSAVSFWLQLDVSGPKHPGQHLVEITTWGGLLRLSYFVDQHDLVPLSGWVHVDGLTGGREFRLAALVDPPHYAVFVDGIRVIDLQHLPGASLQSPAFAVMGQDVGSVRLTSVRVYVPD